MPLLSDAAAAALRWAVDNYPKIPAWVADADRAVDDTRAEIFARPHLTEEDTRVLLLAEGLRDAAYELWAAQLQMERN